MRFHKYARMNSKLAPDGNCEGKGKNRMLLGKGREWFNESLYIHYYDYEEDYQ